jgi:hypothetical protein
MQPLTRRVSAALACLVAFPACSNPDVTGLNPGAGGASGTAGATGGGGNQGGGGRGAAPPDAGFTFTPPDAGSGAGGAAPGAMGGTMPCGFQKHQLDRVPPELLLVLDRSGSMLIPAAPGAGAGTPTRWDETTAAVTDVVRQTDGSIHWGLKSFPTPYACLVAPGIEVPIGPTSAAVADAIAATLPSEKGSGTPTGRAVQIATEYLRSRATINPKYLVLATDGQPACPGAGDELMFRRAAVDAITAAGAAGVPTFVIGIATAGTEADAVLNEMARAGGRPRAGDPAYYPVASKQSLVAALGQITRVVTTCDFPLTSTPPSPNDVAVNVDGMRVPRDPTRMSGWEYSADGKVVVLHGAVCDLVKAGKAKNVDIIFGCPNVPIP